MAAIAPPMPQNSDSDVHSFLASQDRDVLLKSVKDDIKKLLTDDVRGDTDREKVFQFRDARKQDLYWNGNQFLAPTFDASGVLADWSPITGNVKYNKENQTGLYDYVINDIRGYGRKFCAVLQRPPNVRAVPNRNGDERGTQLANKANRLIALMRSLWDVERANRELALGLYKAGTTFIYTPYITNEDKFGYVEEPIIELRDTPITPERMQCVTCGTEAAVEPHDIPPPACPQCQQPFGPEDYLPAETAQIPEITGTKRYSNGSVEFNICNIFTVTTPFYCKHISDVPFLIYEYEEHQGALISAYPSLRDSDISKGSGDGPISNSSSSAMGRLARDSASTVTGAYISPRKNRWLYTRVWVRPSMYELMTQEIVVGGQQVKARDICSFLYPKGAKFTFVRDEFVEATEERLDKVWAVCKSDLSEYMYSDAYCKDMMGIQDLINDMHNIEAQTRERAVPILGVDVSAIDLQMIKSRPRLPAEYMPFKKGTNLDTVMKQLPMASTDPDSGKWIDGTREHGAEIIGIQRSIFGASLPNETAHQAELNKNQSMAQINLIWNEMRSAHAQATQNAVLQFAEHSGGRLPDPNSPGQIIEIDQPEELLEGGWHVEAAEDMPMSWSERRAWFMQLLSAGNPQILQLFGFTNEENIPGLQETFGMDGWIIPNRDARDKVMDNIRQLLNGKPVPTPMPDGSTQLMPSVVVDQFEDEHEFVVMVIKDWSQTQDAREDRKKNPDGYANVIAFAKMHSTMIPVAPGAMGAPPPAPGAGPKPPAGAKPVGKPPGLPALHGATAPAGPQATPAAA